MAPEPGQEVACRTGTLPSSAPSCRLPRLDPVWSDVLAITAKLRPGYSARNLLACFQDLTLKTWKYS